MQLRMFKRGAMIFPTASRYSWAHKVSHKASLWCLESDEYHFCPALCFMVWFMAECLQGWAGDPPPWSRSLFRHINTDSAELWARPAAWAGVRSVWWPGREDGDAAERPGRPAEPELNNLKTKSCDVWELLARALAWSGPICLLGPQCKGYFNLNSNVPTLQQTFEVQNIQIMFIYTVYCLHWSKWSLPDCNSYKHITSIIVSSFYLHKKFLDCMNLLAVR